MNDCLMPPIYSLYRALALLPLISLHPLWVFDGWIAILPRLVFYFVITQLATSGWLGLRTVPYYGYGRIVYGCRRVSLARTRTVKVI